MILYLIFSFIILLLNLVFWMVSLGGHSVTIASIPFFGEQISSSLVTAIGYWNLGITVIPYFQLPWTIFLYIVIPFEIALIVAKIFLGSRVPASIN